MGRSVFILTAISYFVWEFHRNEEVYETGIQIQVMVISQFLKKNQRKKRVGKVPGQQCAPQKPLTFYRPLVFQQLRPDNPRLIEPSRFGIMGGGGREISQIIKIKTPLISHSTLPARTGLVYWFQIKNPCLQSHPIAINLVFIVNEVVVLRDCALVAVHVRE